MFIMRQSYLMYTYHERTTETTWMGACVLCTLMRLFPTLSCLCLAVLLAVATTEHKPWDEIHGYHTIQGNMRVSGVTFANFPGAGVCGQGSFAIGNHHFAPDAFHPHFFSKVCSEWGLRVLCKG